MGLKSQIKDDSKPYIDHSISSDTVQYQKATESPNEANKAMQEAKKDMKKVEKVIRKVQKL